MIRTNPLVTLARPPSLLHLRARQREVGSRLAAVVAVLAVALALPAAASAHADLPSASPPVQGRIGYLPRLLTLRFDAPVRVFPSSIRVWTMSGTVVSGAATSATDQHVAFVRLRPLQRGSYTVRWHVLASDGHVSSGVYTFGVFVTPPPPTSAYGSSSPSLAEDFVRWGFFAGLSLLIGSLSFRLLVLPRTIPRRLERRLNISLGLGLLALLELAILGFMLRAEDALQVPFTRFLDADLSSIAGGTRYGDAFIGMTLGFVVVAALCFLSWLFELRWPLWLAFALALGLGSGLSLSGHSGVDPGSSWLTATADWIHLVGAMVWVGGLVQLTVSVWPVAPQLRRASFRRFSQLATLLVVVVLAAGAYLAIVRLPSPSDLWESGYGRLLLAKLLLVSVALGLGWLHHRVARHPTFARLARRRPTLGMETAAVALILLLTAALVNAKPPLRQAAHRGTDVFARRGPTASPSTASGYRLRSACSTRQRAGCSAR